jgi:sugar lactone lactonase YvrE
MTAIESSQNTILLADSKLGAVWALDMETGESQIAIIDPSFQPSYEYPMGINGIKTYGDDLYFTNSVQRLYGSIPIDGNGFATGPVNKLLTLNGFQSDAYDDFAMDRQGNAFIATHPNAVFKVSREGRLIGLLSSELLVQPTSATLGRGSAKEESTLYVSTGGRSSEPTIWDSTDDGPIVGGQVFAIDA